MVAAVATSERLSWQAVQCNHDRCAVTRLLAFCTHGTVNILNIHGHGRRCSTADAGEMWTHSSGIHTSLVAIRRGKTMRSDVIPNDKRRSSMSLHVAGLTSSRGPHVCPGTWLTLTVCRGDKYIATRRHACTHWPAPYNADRNFFLESVSAVSAELRYPLIDRVPGIHRYFVHYGTRVAHVGPGWTTTQVLTSLVQHRTAKYFKDCNSIPAFFPGQPGWAGTMFIKEIIHLLKILHYWLFCLCSLYTTKCCFLYLDAQCGILNLVPLTKLPLLCV